MAYPDYLGADPRDPPEADDVLDLDEELDSFDGCECSACESWRNRDACCSNCLTYCGGKCGGGGGST